VTSQAAGDHWEAGELQMFEPPELFLGCRGLPIPWVFGLFLNPLIQGMSLENMAFNMVQ
jgi:hypothetical protein